MMKRIQPAAQALSLIAALVLVILVSAAGCDRGQSEPGGTVATLTDPGGASGNLGSFARYYNTIPPNTLLLAEYRGPDVSNARQLEQELKQAGLKDAFVIANDNEAFLCYGIYQDTNPTTNKRYAEDKHRLSLVQLPNGQRAFGFLMAVPLPEPTPPSPYDVTQATAPYTVMVGIFDLYGRKQQAADYTHKLRQQGWEAYVFQGEAMSHVVVGAFHTEIFEPLAPGEHAQRMRKIRSPEVKKIIADFRYLNWNGHQFSDDDTDELKLRITGQAVRGPRAGSRQTVTEDLSGMVRVGVFRIPDQVWTSAGLPVPAASITPRTTVLQNPPGPILSPQR